VLWVSVALVVLLLAAGASAYLWFRDKVNEANERVPDEVMTVLTEPPPTTIAAVGPATDGDTTTSTIKVPDSPSAMDILILGSDRRPDEEDSDEYARSDTIILAHIDPENDYMSLLSLPRDLRVNVPGYGHNKINFAFAAGGPALTIKTIEELTGIDIKHYVEVSFQAFCDITDAMGGVYVDVDRRYYNDNAHYELINLAPGYQLLNGADALDFVRFRHDLNLDFGRMERQQMYLTAMREQAMGWWDLPVKLPKMIGALFNNLTTDLGANDFLNLAYWGVRLDGSRIRRVTLVGSAEEIEENGRRISYVLASKNRVAEAVNTYYALPGTTESDTGTGSSPAGSTTTSSTLPAADFDLEGVEIDVMNANGRSGEAASAGNWLEGLGATVVTVDNAGRSEAETYVEYPAGASSAARSAAQALGLETTVENESAERVTVILGDDFSLPTDYALPPGPNTVPAAGGWKTIAQMVPFAVQAPYYIPEDYYFVERMPVEGATYDIEVGGGSKPAFKMLYRLKSYGEWTDQYMGITETTWLDAPAACEGRQVERDGVAYTIVGSADKVERIWWKSDGVLYWVSNTLFHLLSQEELLKVAESMIYIPD